MDKKDVLDLLRMREVHLPYREISEVLGITPAAAHKEAGKHLSGDVRLIKIEGGVLYFGTVINGETHWTRDDGR